MRNGEAWVHLNRLLLFVCFPFFELGKRKKRNDEKDTVYCTTTQCDCLVKTQNKRVKKNTVFQRNTQKILDLCRTSLYFLLFDLKVHESNFFKTKHNKITPQRNVSRIG